MANGYGSMERLCEDVKRVGELEKLMGKFSSAKSSVVPEYQAEHNKLVRKINNYISKNYSGDALAFAIDFYQHMISEKEDAIEEFRGVQMRLMENERESQKEIRNKLIKSIEDLGSFLREQYELKSSQDQ